MPSLEAQRKKSNRQMILVIIGVIVAAVVIFGGGAFLFAQVFSGNIKSPLDYKTYELKLGQYTTTIDCEGTIQPIKSSSVFPEVDGTIVELKVKEGDKVEKGDVLMVLENPTITKTAASNKTSLERAEDLEEKAQSSYESAQSSLAEAQARRDEAYVRAQQEAEAARQQEAQANAEVGAEDGSVQEEDISAAEDVQVTVDPSYDEAVSAAQSALDSAEQALDAASANTSAARDAYESAKQQEDLLTVRAPDNGTVLNLKAEQGMTTAALNVQGAAMQVADISVLQGVVAVPEKEAGMVSRGQEAQVRGDALGETVVPASVTSIADAPNEQTAEDGSAFYNATLTIGENEKVKVGMKIVATISLQDHGAVYYVPAQAIVERDGAYYIEIIYNDNTSSQHQVQLIATLEDGQHVIKSSILSDGVKIRADLTE